MTDRSDQFFNTLELIKEQPLLGRSLGGVAAGIAAKSGKDPNTTKGLKTNWGFPVIVEVVAASGFFAFLPFLWFFWTNTFGETVDPGALA